jgi:hypothetical protein
MTSQEFNELSKDLKTLSEIVPLNWGTFQNNDADVKINMLQLNSFKRLESEIVNFAESDKNYFRRRWFLWECSRCDAHLFALNKNVAQNLNTRDETYNIEFNNNPDLRFDLKGTVIPNSFRNNVNEVFLDPTKMTHFFYDEETKGEINQTQNHLFIIHYSHIGQEREIQLRCMWDFKAEVYKKYAEKIATDSNFIRYNNAIADIIFIIENEDKTITSHFYRDLKTHV